MCCLAYGKAFCSLPKKAERKKNGSKGNYKGINRKDSKQWLTAIQKDGLKNRSNKSVSSDGSPPTALPVVEQIGPATEYPDCCVNRESADRWLPPSIVHQEVYYLHWLEVHAHTTHMISTCIDWWPVKLERENTSLISEMLGISPWPVMTNIIASIWQSENLERAMPSGGVVNKSLSTHIRSISSYLKLQAIFITGSIFPSATENTKVKYDTDPVREINNMHSAPFKGKNCCLEEVIKTFNKYYPWFATAV